jgi:N6-adenosine-specific RNA methylase IME4
MMDIFGDLPRSHFGAIIADPPWHFKSYSALKVQNPGSRRDVERHYPVMGIEAIKAMPVQDLAAKDAHLFLWTTSPTLPQAFDVIKAWGFRYSSTGFVWVKLKKSVDTHQMRLVPLLESDLHVGLGLTTRKNAEFCLLARRGSPKRISNSIREIILSPVREHSRKPDEAFDRVKRYCAGPYLDLFSRESRPGWSAWGNEAGKFDRMAAE